VGYEKLDQCAARQHDPPAAGQQPIPTRREDPSIVPKAKKPCSSRPADVGEVRLEQAAPFSPHSASGKQAKIEIFGSEIIEKRVRACANSGRVYLPPEWIGHKVKIIRID
jgi:putative transposon-encoded protein